MQRGLAALLMLTACSRPLPPGVERLTPRGNASAFFWSPSSRRLAYVEGRFPDRTFLVVANLASGQRTRTRLKGFVLGKAIALSRDGRRVLLDAGKIGPYPSRSEPAERVLLFVDGANGAILSETLLGPGGTAALGHPAWSPDPIAAWNHAGEMLWRGFGVENASGTLRGPVAWRGLLLDMPYLVVSEKQTHHPRLTAYDLGDGRTTAQWPAALSVVPLGIRPDGAALAARWTPESGRFVLESCDTKTGKRTPLLEAEGEIETAFETDRALYAVAKDPTRRNDTGKIFLAPRVLLVVEADGRRWSVPWSAHEGAFLGVDPASGRLLFAVTDRDKPGAWAISPTRAALAAAGPAINGKVD